MFEVNDEIWIQKLAKLGFVASLHFMITAKNKNIKTEKLIEKQNDTPPRESNELTFSKEQFCSSKHYAIAFERVDRYPFVEVRYPLS